VQKCRGAEVQRCKSAPGLCVMHARRWHWHEWPRCAVGGRQSWVTWLLSWRPVVEPARCSAGAPTGRHMAAVERPQRRMNGGSPGTVAHRMRSSSCRDRLSWSSSQEALLELPRAAVWRQWSARATAHASRSPGALEPRRVVSFGTSGHDDERMPLICPCRTCWWA